jgi:hypothetical protein
MHFPDLVACYSSARGHQLALGPEPEGCGAADRWSGLD